MKYASYDLLMKSVNVEYCVPYYHYLVWNERQICQISALVRLGTCLEYGSRVVFGYQFPALDMECHREQVHRKAMVLEGSAGGLQNPVA